MISPSLARLKGLIPIKSSPVRFAVGPPNGSTSNAWRIWTSKHDDIYIACRDNFKEAKVSLHTSGRWRMGFTTEAINKNSNLVQKDENRAWEVWDQPPPLLENTIVAFHLLFPPTELGVRPEQRVPKEWKNVIFIESAPVGKMTVITLFITIGNIKLVHHSEPSFCLASLPIGNGRYAQLIAHGEPEGNIKELIEKYIKEILININVTRLKSLHNAYGYFFGRRDDGSRYIVGAYLNR